MHRALTLIVYFGGSSWAVVWSVLNLSVSSWRGFSFFEIYKSKYTSLLFPTKIVNAFFFEGLSACLAFVSFFNHFMLVPVLGFTFNTHTQKTCIVRSYPWTKVCLEMCFSYHNLYFINCYIGNSGISKLDICEGGSFSTAIFNSDILRSFFLLFVY